MADVAAFDFDGTLTEGGSVFDFLSPWSVGPTVLSATAALAPRLAHAALAGGAAADQTKEQLFVRILAGSSSSGSSRSPSGFARHHLARHLRADVRAAARLAPRPGRPGGHRVGLSRGLRPGGRPAPRGRRGGGHPTGRRRRAALTGRYEGANCRGEEKLRRLRAWMDEDGVVPDRLWAYGNSRGDLRMLRAADVGVNVGRLGRLGRLRAYPGLDGTPAARLSRECRGRLTGTPSSASTPGRTSPRWAAGRR